MMTFLTFDLIFFCIILYISFNSLIRKANMYFIYFFSTHLRGMGGGGGLNIFMNKNYDFFKEFCLLLYDSHVYDLKNLIKIIFLGWGGAYFWDGGGVPTPQHAPLQLIFFPSILEDC